MEQLKYIMALLRFPHGFLAMIPTRGFTVHKPVQNDMTAYSNHLRPPPLGPSGALGHRKPYTYHNVTLRGDCL